MVRVRSHILKKQKNQNKFKYSSDIYIAKCMDVLNPLPQARFT